METEKKTVQGCRGGRPMLRMESTDDFPMLRAMFLKNGLEYDDDDEPDPHIIGMWKVTHNGYPAAGTILCASPDCVWMEGLAVEPAYRKLGLGKILVEKCAEEARKRGAREMYLIGRKPEFYKKLGFTVIPLKECPVESDCAVCSQYRISCFPEAMKLEL